MIERKDKIKDYSNVLQINWKLLQNSDTDVWKQNGKLQKTIAKYFVSTKCLVKNYQ